MDPVVHRAGEGEALFGGRIVIKADFEHLCITESIFGRARPGAGPHVHRQHADTFYVLEGELAFLVVDEERRLGAGACVCAPAGVVHGFRSTSRARFLNFHTLECRVREQSARPGRGEPGGFDSFDAEVGTGLPAATAILLDSGEGELLDGDNRIATIKIGRDELSLVEYELEPGFERPEPHTGDAHVDSVYVLDGQAEFLVGNETLQLGAGSFVAAPPGVVRAFSSGPGRSRLLNVRTPSSGFHRRRRESSERSVSG